jgi:hypothetical protein
MDKTIHNPVYTTANPYIGGRISSISNVPVFQGNGVSPSIALNSPYPYDRQFPEISETHKCRLVGCSVTFEMVTGNLANTTGNLVIALVPEADSWGEITGPLFNQEDLAIMHGSMTITATELAAQPVTVTFARVGSLADSFKPSAPMSFVFSKQQRSKIENGKGFTHQPHRVHSTTPTAPSAMGDSYHPTQDVLMPVWFGTFSDGTELRLTIERHWDLQLVPQDTSVMSGVNATRSLSTKTAEKVSKITHALPVVPAPTPAMPAQTIVDRIVKSAETGAEWLNQNQDNIEAAGKVFGTTVKIGTKLAAALL